MSNRNNSEKSLKSAAAISIELGNKIPRTMAGRLELIMELSTWTIKTGKRGRPRKLFSKKDLKKLLEMK